jgi:hypothetical protein
VAHAHNPSYLGGQRSGGSRFEASPSKQFKRHYLQKTLHKKGPGGVAQGVGPEFKPQYHKKREKEREKEKSQAFLLVFGGTRV